MSGPRLNEDPDAVLADIELVRRRRPRLRDDHVTLAHGAGGKASAALVDQVFLEGLRNPLLEPLADGAVMPLPGTDQRLAMSTDTYVVRPWRFPGGSVGSLAVHGTVNDLACVGAVPQWLSAGFIIEEGFAMDDLRAIVADMRRAADDAGVSIVTGDTKVVDRGAGDGVYVCTAGVGLVAPDRDLTGAAVQPGDKVLVSGRLADHGVAVMLARGDLHLDADVRSDSAPLAGMVQDVLAAAPATRWIRDATRGGVGTVLNELARDTGHGVVLSEPALPIAPTTEAACDLLGIDPLYVANEGLVVVVVPADQGRDALEAMTQHEHGANAAVVGEVRAEPANTVVIQTVLGGTRIVDMLVGDPLPRIC